MIEGEDASRYDEASRYDVDDGLTPRDTPAEVDAASRTLRRVALGYFLLFLGVLVSFPLLSLTLDWWSRARLPGLLGDLSPAFLTAGAGLYLVFAVIGVAAASLSSAVEARMLGDAGAGDDPEDPGEPPDLPDPGGNR